MLNFYRLYTTTYYKDKEVRTEYCGMTLTDTPPENFTDVLTWDNIAEKYANNGGTYPFNLWKLRRGRRVSFFNDFGEKIIRDIKEWKGPLDLKVKYEYHLYTPPINKILDFYDGEKAIQYLVERGLAITGK